MSELIIVFANGNKIQYLYTSDGTKQKKLVYTGATLTYTHLYSGHVVFRKNGTGSYATEYINMPDGRLTPTSAGFQYQYFLKDHLGNVYVSFTDVNNDGNAEILGTDHYYPFGLTLAGLSYNNSGYANLLKYNSKELQEDFNLGWYDYGARFYDPQIGRFTTIDPHAENYYDWTPFNYVANNPMNLIDPDGRDWYQDKGGNTKWQKGSAEVDGYKNLGANYTHNIGSGASITYTQNEATSMTESVLSPNDFKTQMSGKFDKNGKPIKKEGEAGNCYYQAGEMVKKSGTESLPGDANKADDGIKYMDMQIDKGNSTRVYVDRNNDGKGDHWVAISSRTTDLKTNQKSYGFFDPAATYSNKGGVNNKFNVVNGKLTGTANAYQSRKVTYEVVQARKNKN